MLKPDLTLILPLDDLLKPVSTELPCGEDGRIEPLQRQWEEEKEGPRKAKLKTEIARRQKLDDELRRQVQNLEFTIQSREKFEMVNAKGEHREAKLKEEVKCNWAEVKEASIGLLRQFKHLRVAMILCLAALREDGLAGFRDGLTLMHQLLARYWDTVFPRLDPEDAEPAGLRLSILNSLATPLDNESAYTFVSLLRDLPLCNPNQGAYGLRQVSIARGESAAPVPGLTLAEVERAFRATPVPELQATFDLLTEIQGRLNEIKALLVSQGGEGNSPSWDLLETFLQAMRDCVAPYLGLRPLSVPVSGTPIPGAASSLPQPPGTVPRSEMPPALALPGAVNSRKEVEAALDAVCDYYRRCEPSSPVPLLLERARRLANLKFLEIMEDLHPDSLKELRNITGAREEDK